MQLINQLANNLKSKTGKCFESHFRPNGRKSAPSRNWLIDRKEPFWTRKQSGNSPPRIARNRHDLDRNCFTRFAHFAALLSREMDEPALRFIGSMAMILLFWSARWWRASGKICVNFVQNWHYTNPSISLFCRACLLIIYILHNNICFMCLLFLCLHVYYVYLYYLMLMIYIMKIIFKVLIISVLCLLFSCKSTRILKKKDKLERKILQMMLEMIKWKIMKKKWDNIIKVSLIKENDCTKSYNRRNCFYRFIL
jgi:hypothetical protein